MIRIGLFGNAGVGKTELINRFRSQFIVEEVESGIKLSYEDIEFILIEVPSKWDATHSSHYEFDMAMIIYDVTSRTSFNTIHEWEKIIREHYEISYTKWANKLDLASHLHEHDDDIYFITENLTHVLDKLIVKHYKISKLNVIRLYTLVNIDDIKEEFLDSLGYLKYPLDDCKDVIMENINETLETKAIIMEKMIGKSEVEIPKFMFIRKLRKYGMNYNSDIDDILDEAVRSINEDIIDKDIKLIWRKESEGLFKFIITENY